MSGNVNFILTGEDIKNSKSTIILIIINIIVFIFYNPYTNASGLYMLAAERTHILNGEIYRAFTSMFIHFDIMHIFSNMIGLLLFGALIENNSTKFEYWFLYLCSGFCSSLIASLIYPPNTYLGGASGAIYALMGAAILLYYKKSLRVFLYALFYIALSFSSAVGTNVSLLGHFMGLAFGILISLCYIQITKYKLKKKIRNNA